MWDLLLSSCFLLNIPAPPRSLVPKTHDIKCCLTTSFGERRTINGTLFIRFTRGISLTFVNSLDKEGTDFSPGCCFLSFNVFVLTPDCSSLLEPFRNLMQNMQPNKGDFSLRPNQTSTFVHVMDNQNSVFPYACALFFKLSYSEDFWFCALNRRETAFNGS